MLHQTLANFNVAIHSPHVPGLLLGPSDGINSVRYNTVHKSTVYIKITLPNTLLGSNV